jgi:hypothetical protein
MPALSVLRSGFRLFLWSSCAFEQPLGVFAFEGAVIRSDEAAAPVRFRRGAHAR